MNRKIGSCVGTALAILVGVSPMVTLAQESQAQHDRLIIERERSLQGPEAQPPARIFIEGGLQGPGGPMPAPPAGDFIFLATEMSFGGKLVKGAPYSAEAVTESSQTLSDGNRIVNKSTATIYRDSEGRTRREQTFKAIGAFAKGGEPHQTIFISDPVAGTSYTLDPNSRIAHKMPPMRFKVSAARGEATPGVRVEEKNLGQKKALEEKKFKVAIESDVVARKKFEAGVSMGWVGARYGNARTEDLGTQLIEGVQAEGKRTIVTIAAGEIGNERDIVIVSERWYSPELQTIVMTSHTDPRFGENSYRLTNISRTEPARSLFEVPADYTVEEARPKEMRIRKPAPPPHD